MMKNKLYKKFVLPILFAILFVQAACKEDDAKDPVLSVSISSLSIPAEGGNAEITVTSSDSWRITNTASGWLVTTMTSGGSGTYTIEVSGGPNETGAGRTGILTVISDNGQARRVLVSQAGNFYPSYNTSPKPPDESGMSSTATQLAAKMRLGWNIGNTFEAPGGETGWGSPVITEDFIKFVKQSGFNAIRIPCAWDWYHIDNKATAHIDPNWMNRVKEVVGYCVKNDVYVLLNIHWDGGWLDHNINKNKKDSVNAKQKAYWEQIATAMRDFDEHLMFASANEPPVDGNTLEEQIEKMDILTSYHQTFIDAVRSTGGRNSYRVLVVQGPSTDIIKTYDLMNTLPTDHVTGRMMVEIHNYTPAQFCLLKSDASWGKMFYYWGANNQSSIEPDRNATWGQENDQISNFEKMKEKFVDKGIPVIMGEYGAYRRDNSENVPMDLETHNNSIDHWATFVTKQALSHGVIPFWWDTGGALDRSNLTVKDKRTIDALNAGAE